MSDQLLTPVARGERIVALDALRGFALLGIVLINAPAMAMPIGIEGLPPGSSYVDSISWLVVHQLCFMRFIALFSLLFGCGFAIQADRAAERGQPHWPLWVRRMTSLALIGLFHGIFLWFGDILFIYACTGVLLLAFTRARAKTMLIWGCALLVLYLVLFILLMSAGMMDWGAPTARVHSTSPAIAPDAPRGLRAIFDAMGDPTDPRWSAAEAAAYRQGPWGDALAFRLVSFFYMLIIGLLGPGWRVLALFIIGGGLLRAGFFTHPTWPRRFLIAGLLIGVPCSIAEGWHIVAWDFGMAPMTFGASLFRSATHEFGALGMASAYLGGITMAARAAPALLAPLAAVGRMALTVYLGETIVITGLTMWWGLGLYGSLGHAALMGIALACYVGWWIFAVLWQRRFRMGPLEWVWRTVSYGTRPPLLR